MFLVCVSKRLIFLWLVIYWGCLIISIQLALVVRLLQDFNMFHRFIAGNKMVCNYKKLNEFEKAVNITSWLQSGRFTLSANVAKVAAIKFGDGMRFLLWKANG